MTGQSMKRTITPEARPKMNTKEKENHLEAQIKQLKIDNKQRQIKAAKRGLTSQIGDRLKLSKN